MKNNMLELHNDGHNFSMKSSPVGKQGRKSNSKPKTKSKQEEFPRMTIRKLSKNADLKKDWALELDLWLFIRINVI